MQNGIVKWFDSKKGYGFIAQNGEPDLFVHYSAVISKGFKDLEQGQKVTFQVVDGRNGKQADRVTVINEVYKENHSPKPF